MVGTIADKKPGALFVNVQFYQRFQKWFEFFLSGTPTQMTVSSVQDHLCQAGLPSEFVEDQFVLRGNAGKQSAKLTLL